MNKLNVDILVNNAGYGYCVVVEEGDMQDISTLFETNVWGLVALIKKVLSSMRKQHRGIIVNVSSHASMESGYKKCFRIVNRSIKETESLGIKVMIVKPGALKTDFTGRSLTQSFMVIEDYKLTTMMNGIY